MSLRVLGTALIGILALSTSCYAMTPVECPPKVSVTESISSHGNWSGYKRTSLRPLQESLIYQGNLGDTRFLQAPAESSKGNQLIQIWDLETNGRESFWIECHYADTSATIRRKIPYILKQCLRMFQRDQNHNAVNGTNIICR